MFEILLVVASLAAGGLLAHFSTKERKKPSRQAQDSSGTAPGLVELTEKLAVMDTEVRKTARALADLDEAWERRFQRLRKRDEREAREEAAAALPDSDDPAQPILELGGLRSPAPAANTRGRLVPVGLTRPR